METITNKTQGLIQRTKKQWKDAASQNETIIKLKTRANTEKIRLKFEVNELHEALLLAYYEDNKTYNDRLDDAIERLQKSLTDLIDTRKLIKYIESK